MRRRWEVVPRGPKLPGVDAPTHAFWLRRSAEHWATSVNQVAAALRFRIRFHVVDRNA